MISLPRRDYAYSKKAGRRNIGVQRRGVQRRGVQRRGAALLEFAIILPILLALVLGIIEMGRVMMVNQIAINASREGCRRAIIHGANEAHIKTVVNNYLDAAGINSDGRTVTLLDENGAETALADIPSKTTVTVQTRFPYAKNTWGFTGIMGAKFMTARSSMRRE